MACYNHPNAETVGICTQCGKAVCESCAVEIGNKIVCKQCAAGTPRIITATAATTATVTQAKGADEIFCRSCGGIIKKEAEVCPKCGVRQHSVPGVMPSGKNRIVAAILAIILGDFGIHKFYLGKNGQGIIYLIFCWTGIPWLIGIVEGIIYLLASDEEFERKYAR
jgi:TM2 domain-containing membrane protein YozV